MTCEQSEGTLWTDKYGHGCGWNPSNYEMGWICVLRFALGNMLGRIGYKIQPKDEPIQTAPDGVTAK